MHTDELKLAWHALDRRLQQQGTLNLQLFRDARLAKARSSLRPLFWGQVAQIAFGLGVVLLASLLWYRTGASSLVLSPAIVIAGILVHAYGVATIAVAGATLGRIAAIDYSAPVLAIQRQLAGLRHSYVISGMVAGLPWWLMWVLLLMVLNALRGVDLSTAAPLLVWPSLAFGIAGLLATWWFHRWSRRPERAALGRRLDESAAGGSIRRMQRTLDELARFEQE